MEFISKYVSHQPDSNGYIQYSEIEHHTWNCLFTRQQKLLPGRACEEFIQGLAALEITPSCIPQIPDLNLRLEKITGWQLSPVSALISARKFFELLASRHFPVATFIRTPEELDYVQEPDIFHEIFGHGPLLTNLTFADFLHDFAKSVLTFPETDWPLLQRLFWFTMEFGLIQTSLGLRAYGGGILSSISETAYSVESATPLRAIFHPITVFRTPYRIDQLQSVYFVISTYAELHNLLHGNLKEMLQIARNLGEYPPLFAIEQLNPNIHIYAC